MRTFDTLNGGSRNRIAKMRRYRDQWNADPRHVNKLQDGMAGLLQARSHGVGKWSSAAHGIGDALQRAAAKNKHYVSAPWELVDGWRDAGEAHDITRSRHTGWYADADGHDLYVGNVWQLPARNGEPRYVAGYIEKQGSRDDGRDSGYVVLECSHGALVTYDDKEDAARAADSLAESNAEKDREYSERWNEASRHDEARQEAREELRGSRREAREAIAAIRAQQKAGPMAQPVCAILRERIENAHGRMRRALRTIENETDAIANLDMAGEF